MCRSTSFFTEEVCHSLFEIFEEAHNSAPVQLTHCCFQVHWRPLSTDMAAGYWHADQSLITSFKCLWSSFYLDARSPVLAPVYQGISESIYDD